MLTKNPFLVWLTGMMEKLKPADLECGDELKPGDKVLGTISPETLRIMAVANHLIEMTNAKRAEARRRMQEEHLSIRHPEIAALIEEQRTLNERADRAMSLFWATVTMEFTSPEDATGIAFRRGGTIVALTEEEASAGRDPIFPGSSIIVIGGGLESLLRS